MEIAQTSTLTHEPIHADEVILRFLLRCRKNMHKLKRFEMHEIETLLSSEYGRNAHFPRLKEYIGQIRQNMGCVVMVVPKSSITAIPQSDNVLIRARPLSERIVSTSHKISTQIPYPDQHSALGIGTGFFVGKNIVATAAHVLLGDNKDIGSFCFVHGVRLDQIKITKKGIVVSKANIYKPVNNGTMPASDYEYFSEGADWAMVKVIPEYAGAQENSAKFLPATSNSVISNGHKLYAIGHGLMQPAKVSIYGKVIIASNGRPFFECDLTLFGGSSGSPVFSAIDHSLVGIYMRGTQKLTLTNNELGFEINGNNNPFEGQECLLVGKGSTFETRLSSFS